MFKSIKIIIKKYKNVFLLLFILFLGFLLRLLASLKQSFWLDEVLIFNTTNFYSLKQLFFVDHWDLWHPQLFYIFTYFWQKISTKPFFLRLPSVLSFFPSSLAIYFIGKKVLDYKYGLICMLLFAVNPFFVELGFQQKMYSFEIFFMLMSLLSVLYFLKDSNRNFLITFCISSVLGFFTDYSFIWFWQSLFFTLLISYFFIKGNLRKKIKSLLKVFLLSCLFMTAQLSIFIRSLSFVADTQDHHLSFSLINYFLLKISGIPEYPLFVYFIILICIVISGWVLIKSNRAILKFLLLFSILSFGLTLLTAMLLIMIKSFYLVPRNLLVSSFIFIFPLAYLFYFTKQTKKIIIKLIIFFIVLVILVVHTYFSIVRINFEGNPDVIDIQNYIKGFKEDKTFLLISKQPFLIDPLVNYYFRGYADGIYLDNFNVVKVETLGELFSKEDLLLNKHIFVITNDNDVEDYGYRLIRDNFCDQTKTCHDPIYMSI
jgi:hypothetical protein